MKTKLIKKRRKELGLTMLDVAKACGVSEATVSRWESGDIVDPSVSKVVALAKILNLNVLDLLNFESNNEKKANEPVDQKSNQSSSSLNEKQAFKIRTNFVEQKLSNSNISPYLSNEEQEALKIIVNANNKKLERLDAGGVITFYTFKQKIRIQNHLNMQEIIEEDSIRIRAYKAKNESAIEGYIKYDLIKENGELYCVPHYKLQNNEYFSVFYGFSCYN